jgi:hypothetical protein
MGAMLIDSGSMFTEPTLLYEYDENNLVDTTASFSFAPYKNDADLPLT